MVLVWLLPVVLFVGLLASQRVPALPAAMLAMATTLGVAWSSAPTQIGPVELARMVAAGIWIALPAALVILAGLFFAESVARANPPGLARPPDHRDVANTCFVIGPFIETATGFGVGYAVAMSGITRLGIKGSEALALAAFSQYLVPWGALGIGSHISTQIAGVPWEAVGWRCAVHSSLSCCALLPVFWRVSAAAGFAPSRRDRIEWLLTLSGLFVLLISTNWAFPVEVAGLAALGPVLVVRHMMGHGKMGLNPAHLRAAVPYVILVGVLALTRLLSPFRNILEIIEIRPFRELSPFFPLMSPALPLLVIGLVECWHRGGLASVHSIGRATCLKGWQTAALTVVLIGMAWVMVGSGISGAIMLSAAMLAGSFSPVLLPMVGALGGLLTGSNVGAGSMSMPLVAGLGLSSPGTAWVVAAAICAGSAMASISPGRFSLGVTLTGATAEDVKTALSWLTPAIVLVVLGAMAVGLSVRV